MRGTLATNKKSKLFHIPLKFLSLQINHTRKYFFYPLIFIILFIPLIPNIFVPHLKAAIMGQYIQSQSPSTSFSFTAGGISEEILTLQQRLILLYSLEVNLI
jgi:hypothetical protein